MEFTIDFPLQVKIEYPEKDEKQGVVSIWISQDWYSVYYFYRETGEESTEHYIWRFEERYFWTEAGLFDAIKEHIIGDWRLSR
jgi:hypothetical protein